MTTGSNWFQDPALLTAEIKRARTPAADAPAIPGYDELREVARGGQGVVYRGLQRSTRRQVAVKVLLDGALASGAARRRFEREIDMVAGLKHPSVVSVYDSGATADGRLYLVMEYIQGAPLDEAVRAGGAGTPMEIRRTLDLFAAVCDAVQYAHQRGVIHRDLKPSNIRVDAAGVPHILDFGLAKAAASGGPDAARSVLSFSGQFMGSLPWASPEQAAADADRADTRSDVYSLGVILYQLLTGRFPYDVGSGLRSTLDNIVGATPEPAARFRAEVDDEVSTILVRCLQKEPERRYQSAGDLAKDLRAYLAGEPIQAKRDSAWYTVRKTMQRYRLVAIVAGAFVMVIGAALVASLTLWRTATIQRNAATLQAARATANYDFLHGLFSAIDPDKDGLDVKVVDLLDRAATSVDERYMGQDDLRATMHRNLEEMYVALGQNQRAYDQAKAAWEVNRARFGPDSREALGAEDEMWVQAHTLGRSQEAEPALRSVLERQTRLLGRTHNETLNTMGELGQVLKALNRPAEAESLYREAIAARMRTAGPDDPAVIALDDRLANALFDQSKLEDSERLYRDVLERRRRVLGASSNQTLQTAGNLGVLLIQRGKLTEAEPLIREVYADELRRLGDEHPITLSSENNLAKLLQDLGQFDEAERLMRHCLDARTRILGEDHPHTLVTLTNLGALLGIRGRNEESEPLARRALDIRLRTLGDRHLETIISMNNYASTLQNLHRLQDAEGWFRRAVETTDATLPAGHYANALFRMNLGKCLLDLNRPDDAEPCLLKAYADIQASLGEGHAQALKARKNLVRLYEARHQPDKADAYRDAPAAK